MTTAAATLLFLLVIAALVAVVVVGGVVLLLGATAGLSSALAAFVEWREGKKRPERADLHRRGFLRDWASRRPTLRWAAAKVAEVEGREPVEAQRFCNLADHDDPPRF